MCFPPSLNNLTYQALECLDPRQIPWNEIGHRIKQAVGIAFTTLFVVLACIKVNPYICTASLIIGMIWHDPVYEAINKELITPIRYYVVAATVSLIIAFLFAPHFFILATGTLFNAYSGSQINYNNTEINNNIVLN